MKIFWALDLAKPAPERRWAELAPWPGVERHQAVAAVHDGAFYLFGGLRMKAKPGANPGANPEGGTERESPDLRDAYRYREGRWQNLAEAPPSVLWRGRTTIVSGETAPGIRSPAVWQFQAGSKPE